MTSRLSQNAAKTLASDALAPLVSTYRAYQDGWRPPEEVTEVDYQIAKLLPDTDPLKAFTLVGCSFSGKYGGGFARCKERLNYARQAANSLARKFATIERTTFAHVDFLSVAPREVRNLVIYCDPPYADTTGYKSLFDHERFAKLCRSWAQKGAIVLVSEYEFAGREILRVQRKLEMSRAREVRAEKLFLVKP